MSRTHIRRALKFVIVSLLALVMLLTTVSCIPADATDFIESLLEKTDGGEMTFKTRDGETVTVTVSREGQATSESIAEENAEEPEEKITEEPEEKAVKEPEEKCVKGSEEKTSVEKKQADSPNLADYLPSLNGIEDVFRTLGVWEDADRMYDKGLTWAHIAEELGYNPDKMYARLEASIEESLRQARELGLINQEQFEYKYQYYSELAMKWVKEIFTN
jgi:hypothetical protein